jgi:hypothetical protein
MTVYNSLHASCLAHRARILDNDNRFGTESVHLAFLELGKSEVAPGDIMGTNASPEETGLSAPVPGSGIQHRGNDDIVDDTANVVGHAC